MAKRNEQHLRQLFPFSPSLICVTENLFCMSQKEINRLLPNITDPSDAGIDIKLILTNDSRHTGFQIENYHFTSSLVNHRVCPVGCVLPLQTSGQAEFRCRSLRQHLCFVMRTQFQKKMVIFKLTKI